MQAEAAAEKIAPKDDPSIDGNDYLNPVRVDRLCYEGVIDIRWVVVSLPFIFLHCVILRALWCDL